MLCSPIARDRNAPCGGSKTLAASNSGRRPPGGGKSMLMQALCGAAPVGTTGSVTYNGHNLSEFNVVRTEYVTEGTFANLFE